MFFRVPFVTFTTPVRLYIMPGRGSALSYGGPTSRCTAAHGDIRPDGAAFAEDRLGEEEAATGRR